MLDSQKEQLKAGLDKEFSWDNKKLTINELTDTRLVFIDSDGKKTVFTHVEE